MISINALKDAERIVRLTMIVILLTAGVSKLFSDGGFHAYYAQLFHGELRINLPAVLVTAYLAAIPFVEIALGLLLFASRYKNLFVHAWFAFMLSLLFGHYVLEEWSAVNQMLDYVFLGLLCLVLPSHSTWFSRQPDVAS